MPPAWLGRTYDAGSVDWITRRMHYTRLSRRLLFSIDRQPQLQQCSRNSSRTSPSAFVSTSETPVHSLVSHATSCSLSFSLVQMSHITHVSAVAVDVLRVRTYALSSTTPCMNLGLAVNSQAVNTHESWPCSKFLAANSGIHAPNSRHCFHAVIHAIDSRQGHGPAST